MAQQLSDFRQQLDAARGTTDAVQGQLREQARQLGELDALRRQVQEQLGLIERLGESGAPQASGRR